MFEALEPWLGGSVARETGGEAAFPAGLGPGALKVSVHRLRRRFREIIRSEVADTVPEPGDIDPELRHLVEVLARAA